MKQDQAYYRLMTKLRMNLLALNLGLMCDALYELANVSLQLQKAYVSCAHMLVSHQVQTATIS